MYERIPPDVAVKEGNFLLITHPQAVYTSKPLDFKELPEPKNADDNNHSSMTEYSGN